MRKLFLLLMALSLSLAVTANNKLSPGTRVFLNQRAAGVTTPADVKTPLAKPMAINGVEYVECFIYLNGSSFAEVQAAGVQVTGKFDEFVTAKVPVNKIEQVARLASVKMVAIARNARHHTDVAKGITNADKVWDGTNYGLPQGFKGTDVVLGIIDDGIQFNHRAFLKADGTSRVKAVYMPNASSANGGTRATVDGVQLMGYQYTTPAQIAALTCDDNSESHGTHTTGCAAGSQVGNYAGMAPEADLILAGCGASLTETAILSSAKFIGNYAKNVLGKPCVISISLGSDTGPHDGKSSICLGYNQVAEQYGSVILLAAGNEADITGHATKTLASDDDYMTVICNVSGGWWGSGTGDCDIWNSTDDPLQVKVLIMSGNSITAQSDWMSNGSFNGVEVQGGVDANNGRYELYIQSSASKAAFVIKGKSGNEIHVYTDDYYASLATSGSVSGYTLTPGSYDGSMCDDMTAAKVISVGAQASRATDGYGQGDVAYFSSYGTDFNGINHPLVTAPGHYVISSINGYDSYQSSTWSTTFNGTTYKWGEMSGTSMATPVAAGVVVLYLQADPSLDVDRVKEIITETATAYPASSSSPVKARGAGIINALAGIEYILQHQGPTIIAKPGELAFDGYAGETYTQTLLVKGYNLTSPINLAVTGAECYTVSPATITAEDAYNGVEVTVTYAPTEAGTTEATITLSNDDAESQTVALTGNAKPRVPTLIADPTELKFSAKLNKPMVKTVKLTGLFLTGDVTTTITSSSSNVFTVSPATITPDTFDGETPLEVTVTFNSGVEGNYTGTLTFASEGAETQTVTLNATCSDNGTASDPFLDLAKYETIDEAGYTGITKLYNYKEYTDQDCAWLTVSNYGLMENTNTQKWFTHEGEKKFGESTWNATDIFMGNATYFGNSSSRYANWNESNQIFYVTNCSQVKQYAYNSGSTYPLLMDIYECTLNSDGSITASNTAIDHKTSTVYSQAEVISSIELDPDKIYKITVFNDYSRLYEIGFRMPLTTVSAPVATEATEIGSTKFVANWLPCTGALSYTLRVQPVVAAGLLNETFAKCEKAGSQNIASKLDEYTDVVGWTGSTVYSAEGGLRLGTGANVGSLTTPAIDLSTSPGKVYVKFTAKTFTNNSGKSDADCDFVISCGEVSDTVVVPGADEQSYMVALDCEQAPAQTVTFATTAGGKRVILTSVDIYNAEPATGAAAEPMYFTNIADTTAYAVTGLLPDTQYSFDVKAIYDPQVYGKAESSWSNMIFFKTLAGGLYGDVNCDGYVNSADVTALYQYILNGNTTYQATSDVNGDGQINSADVTAVYRIILGSQE